MHNKEIIFFDELGFGWVVDKTLVQALHESGAKKQGVIEKTLADLLRRHR